MPKPILQVGIDIGGTFTDFVVHDPSSGSLDTFKRLSTPRDPAQAVMDGLAQVIQKHHPELAVVIHGSTVATNALLERKGARTALVTTRGFKDVLQIGRQNRPALYDLSADPPEALIPPGLRFEVGERVTHDGTITEQLEVWEVESLVDKIHDQEVESVAVCLLFSFLQPAHEQEIAAALRRAGLLVSVSSEILPEYREYERMSATAVNAYVGPVIDRYLSRLETEMPKAVHLRVMQSNGGNISPGEARRSAVRCILSGPAGGIVGCETVARLAQDGKDGQGNVKVITFDMGGTSTDVSLIDGQPRLTTEAVVSGCPIRIPLLDIHTIGAGGGSIAHLDPGGALRVGPESAGADPGPACYGRTPPGRPLLPTVTDANIVLGRIPPEFFLGGEMPLDADLAHEAFARLGGDLHLDPQQAALGVVQVANAHMESALRVISVERGHDPRDFSLLSFGGAGGLHAADLARSLGMKRLLVPPLASTLSAFGMLAAEVVKDYTRTVMLDGGTAIDEIASLLAPLAARGREEVGAEGVADEEISVESFLDMRYTGQSYELIVPFTASILAAFHDAHRRHYGYATPQAAVEIVNLRLRVIGRRAPPSLACDPTGSADPAPAFLLTRPVVFSSGSLPTRFYRGEALLPGNRLEGPAVIVRPDTTILLGPSDTGRVDGYRNLVVEVGG
ncbi:MAG: hydantoinase/oxoprolinase family protein [Chloroflexi bacterium]|nr:hydantoinase/oxoprolinase family protein [Chloroflexota bacterium]